MNSNKAERRAAVIGAGTAGAAAALFLARQGWRTTVYERVPAPAAVGAGILMQPTGLTVLNELGLLRPFLDHGAPVNGLSGFTRSGRQVFTLDYRELDERLFGLGLHRGVLFSQLFAALSVEEGVTVQTGIEIIAIHQSSDEAVLRDQDGRDHGPFELVIAADGARSSLRSQSGIPQNVHRFPWGVLWLIVPDSENLFPDRLLQYFDGTRKMMGVLPTGRGPEVTDRPRLVSLFWSIHRDQVEAWRRNGLPAWRDQVLRLCPAAEPIVAQVNDSAQMTFAEYYDVRLRRYHNGRLAVLGDAAHAMSPHLGQGANLALLDALILAGCLRESADIRSALAGFSARRAAHLRFYLAATRSMMPFYQSGWTALGALRDLGFPILNRIPFLQQQMLSALVGAKTGVFRGELERALTYGFLEETLTK